MTTEEIQADYEAGFVELNSLSGTVTSPCGTNIANATVTLTIRAGTGINATQTDSTGHYAFADLNAAFHDITATKRSYGSNTNNVTVTADDPETADIVLYQKGDFNTNSEPADANRRLSNDGGCNRSRNI